MPDDLSFLEDERTEQRNRGFTQHDTLTFMGKALMPLSAGTLSLLDQTGNKLLYDSETPFFDAAAFILLHQADELSAREARAMAWSGAIEWKEYVFQFIQNTPDIEGELSKAAPVIRKMIEDYYSILTKSHSPLTKKKRGRPAA